MTLQTGGRRAEGQGVGEQRHDGLDHRARRAMSSLMRPPAVSTLPAVVLVTRGVLAVEGSLVLASTFISPVDPRVDISVVRTMDVIGVLLSAVLVVFVRRMSFWTNNAVIVAAIAMITTATLQSGGGATTLAYSCLYYMVPTYAFLVLSPLIASTHLVITLGAGIWTMNHFPDVSGGDQLVFWGTITVFSWIIGWLVRAADQVEVDALTGLPNRRGAERHLEEHTPVTGGSGIVVAILDLDHFRTLNENGGSSAGDDLLRGATRAWTKLLPAGALLGRYGGDEFILVVRDSTASEVASLLTAMRPVVPGSATFCAGVAGQEDGEPASMLVARAEVALYGAKRAGAGRTRLHDGAGASGAAVREGLASGQFRVHFQPLVDLATGEASGAEALIRWFHPERGLVPPVDFLPEAEHDGVIVDIGAWVLHESCRQAAQWPAAPSGRPLTLSVNASGRELQDPQYGATVETALRTSGLDPRRLTIELVESEYDVESLYVASNLHRLQALGVSTAIDDFGTGYSSLDRVRRIGVQSLKIDKSFVADIVSPDADAPLVRAMLLMAEAMGLKVVAEGIETEVQAEWLRRHGCALGQGFLFGRAEPRPPRVAGSSDARPAGFLPTSP